MTLDIGRCPHRRTVPGRSSDFAECGRLVGLSGIEGGPLAVVGRDACESCLAEIPADASNLNPTLASLLFGLARAVVERGGVPGCTAAEAEALARRSEADLAMGWAAPDHRTPARPRRDRADGTPSKIGLIGWNTPSGLGQLNRDIARHLPIARWLIPTHRAFPEDREPPACPTARMSRLEDIEEFFDGLDSVVFCEHPYHPSIVPMARARGVRVVCVAMWEYLYEMAPWIRQVDIMICPTRICLDVVLRIRERLGLAWEVERFSWPIDLARFPFRPRASCERFLFVNGIGGPASTAEAGRRGTGGRASA